MAENSKANLKQMQFLKKIEDVLPKNTSLVNEISDVLGISTDSAYRRMRAETYLSIDDIIKLCEHFNVSFDTVGNANSGMITFGYLKMEAKKDSFINYLNKLVKDLNIINQSKEKQIIYACEDIPIFHHYRHPILASFKMYYWMNAILNVPELENEKFDSEKISSEFYELGEKIIEAYSNIPSIEIWTETTIHSTIKQIEFFWDSGKFNSTSDALAVCNALREEITLIQKQAENSSKLLESSTNEPDGQKKNYQFYFSDIEITNNSVYVNMGSVHSVYLGHLTFNTMATLSESYCQETLNWLNVIIKKSTLISGVSEKQRYQVFRKYYKVIDELEKKIREN